MKQFMECRYCGKKTETLPSLNDMIDQKSTRIVTRCGECYPAHPEPQLLEYYAGGLLIARRT